MKVLLLVNIVLSCPYVVVELFMCNLFELNLL